MKRKAKAQAIILSIDNAPTTENDFLRIFKHFLLLGTLNITMEVYIKLISPSFSTVFIAVYN